MDALSYGLGIVTTLVLLSPVLVRAWRAHVREGDYRLAQRVGGMVKSILDARDAADPDHHKVKAGRPTRAEDALDAALWEYRNMQDKMEKFGGMLEYLKMGGHPDDDPAKVIRTIEQKGKNK